jgi:hypothetical protein
MFSSAGLSLTAGEMRRLPVWFYRITGGFL